MKQTRKAMNGRLPVALAILVAAILASAEPVSSARAPIGRTYFIVSLGLGADRTEAYEPDAGCLRFTRTEICEVEGDCGKWWPIEEERLARRSAVGFEFDLIDDETGLPIKIEGLGRIDSRGPRSSIAGVAHARDEASGLVINFAIAGRAVGLARCRQLVADFEASRR